MKSAGALKKEGMAVMKNEKWKLWLRLEARHGGHCKLPPVSGAELIKEEIDESESFVLESENILESESSIGQLKIKWCWGQLAEGGTCSH